MGVKELARRLSPFPLKDLAQNLAKESPTFQSVNVSLCLGKTVAQVLSIFAHRSNYGHLDQIFRNFRSLVAEVHCPNEFPHGPQDAP